MPVRVAVIGGGVVGLMALKNFREDGFDATLYEGRAWVGGLWKYSDDEWLSTAENTKFNSSKFRTAIPDFPFSKHVDDFPTASQLYEYLNAYCQHFDLWPHVKLSSRVTSVKRSGERWALEVTPNDAPSYTAHYDKVAFACGSFTSPRQPTLDGIDQFKGRALHAVNFHNPSQFEGQNVLVVGAHASAQDVVAQLSEHASHVYLSHRSGVLLLSRYSSDGSVYDRMPPLNFTIFTLYLQTWFPNLFTWMMDSLIGMMAKKSFPTQPASLGSLLTTKAPSIAVAAPLIASELYPHFESGFCEGVPGIRKISGPRSIELTSDRTLDNVDAIVYCTGYHMTIPVEMESSLNPYAYPGSSANLYRQIFPLHPDPDIRNSLAFLGQAAVPLPGFAQHEMVSMCISQVWRGKSRLPPLAEMQRWHRNIQAWRADQTKRYQAQSTFYPVFVPMADHLAWMDSCAGLGMRRHFGLLSRWTNWEAWKFWWNDRELYNLCLTGLSSPAIFRLFDEGKRKAWAGARKQILLDNESVKLQQQERQKQLQAKKEI
ncbi:flavin-containing monooxygenase-like protein [Neohortaea acidophila]|uniref:Flavin-containing monooxygenase-like protein n=1 Tax=Neohortaea acidophila TaxID=245834 RepID=A0A6A6PYA5_9PEZI|nr:flavin-containing monooxygenase-like protein [Neohortaea acidophila]KAF2484207.1 flavin-containing monooxygenase-like protein [Neohortaea acidophila]